VDGPDAPHAVLARRDRTRLQAGRRARPPVDSNVRGRERSRFRGRCDREHRRGSAVSGDAQPPPARPVQRRLRDPGHQPAGALDATRVLCARGLVRRRPSGRVEMTARHPAVVTSIAAAAAILCAVTTVATRAASRPPTPQFHTSDRCLACHNGLLTPSGDDVSIGYDWRASMMANSSRDPYWQASVRRESVDHPESTAAIEDECSICHMPIPGYETRVHGGQARVSTPLPFAADAKEGRAAADGVSCAVCHQIGKQKLGTPDSFNGGFVVDTPSDPDARPEYGPFEIEPGHRRIMLSSTEGYRPTQSDHIRDSELCVSCHTLLTQALGPGGRTIGRLPEQGP